MSAPRTGVGEYEVRSDYLDHAEQIYNNAIADLAAGLADLATKIARYQGKPLGNGAIDRGHAFASQAAEILHEYHWGLANLSSERLVTRAYEADYAAREAVREAQEAEREEEAVLEAHARAEDISRMGG